MIRVITHAQGYRAFTHARNGNRVITHALWITRQAYRVITHVLSCFYTRSIVLSPTPILQKMLIYNDEKALF